MPFGRPEISAAWQKIAVPLSNPFRDPFPRYMRDEQIAQPPVADAFDLLLVQGQERFAIDQIAPFPSGSFTVP